MAKDRKPRSAEDLLGEMPRKKPPRPEDSETEWHKLRDGVTQNWLVGFTRMHPNTVKRRLGKCPVLKKEAGRDVYDPMIALSYLINPQIDVYDYIKNMQPNELPVMLRKEFWDAENKRLNYEERSGELWHTSDVHEVLSNVFKQIKNQMQVWTDDVERETKLTPEQYKILEARVDALRKSLDDTLKALPSQQFHGSVLETRNLDGRQSDESEEED